jgi:drug/metabolite transporter (DMT)-like permease
VPVPLVRVHVALIAVSLLFGANYVFTKQILVAGLPARAWVFVRIAAATVLLLPLAWRLGRGRWPLGRLPALALASFLGIVLNQVLFTEGMALTTAEHSAVINACIPTWTLIAAVLCGQERLTAAKVGSIVLALLGVQYLLGVDRLLLAGGPLDRDQLIGDLLTVANGISFAFHLVLMRKVGRDIDPWRATALMFVAATLMVGTWSGPSLTAENWQLVATPPVLWFGLYGVLFATVLTYSLNTWALQHVRSSQVALYINLQPLVAAGLSMAMGHPVPGVRFAVAMLLVFAGLWLRARSA